MSTVRVTDKKIPMNAWLVKKLDLMIERVMQKKPKLDAVIQTEGGEGSGKTTMAEGIAYYVHWVTKRKFTQANTFLDTKKAVAFAQSTEEQIIIFDEPALDLLSAQWWNEVQQDLIKLVMLSRKKRHFIIFNFTKFWKFNEYIVVDRSLCMLHLYQRKDNNNYAFCYIPKDALPYLYNDYKKKNKRNYFKYVQFTGEFPDVLDAEKPYNILDIFDVKEYEREKDLAIASIGKKKFDDYRMLKNKVGRLKMPITTQEQLAKQLHVDVKTLRRWREGEDGEKEDPIEVLPSETGQATPAFIYTGGEKDENVEEGIRPYT